jgi:hypothetical protein
MATYADNQIAKTSGYIAKEAGLGFYNNAVLTPMVDTQYSAEYGTKSGGARVGNTIRVRFPAQFITTSSVQLDSSTVQAIEEDTKVLTLDQRVGVHAEISTEQATLELESKGSEYSERVLQPMGKALVAKVESLGFAEIGLKAQNTIVLETPFADGDVLRKEFVKMRALLDKQLAPAGDRCAILGSDAEVEVSNSVLPLFHSQKEIEMAYKEGKMGMFGGMTWMASDLVYTRVNGAGGEGGTVGSYTEGSETIVLTAAASGDLDNLAVGDKIEIAAKLVNAESKLAYANNIQRAVKSVTGSGATVTITIDPIYTAESGAKQNTAGATSAAAIVGAAVTVLGTAGESYLVCPVFQKKGVTLGNADLYLPKNVEMASRNKVHNVAQRFIRDYQIGTDALPSRYECLITWDLLRPEWCGAVELKIS